MKKSAWQKGIEKYAEEMTNDNPHATTEKDPLNGAKDWHGWAYDGCPLDTASQRQAGTHLALPDHH